MIYEYCVYAQTRKRILYYNTNSTNFCHFFNANTDSPSCRSKGEYNTGDLNVQSYIDTIVVLVFCLLLSSLSYLR